MGIYINKTKKMISRITIAALSCYIVSA